MRYLLLQPHPVVVEPVGDGSGGEPELAGQELDGCHIWVRVQVEGKPERFLLLFAEEYSLLLGGRGSGSGRIGVVELRRVIGRRI